MRYVASTVIGLTMVSGSTAFAHIYTYAFGMSERWVVPESGSTAIGGGLMSYNHHTFGYSLDLTIQGVTLDDLLPTGPNGTSIHGYIAPRGEVGDIAVDFEYFGVLTEQDNSIRLVVDNARFGGDQGGFSSSIFETENALYDGNLYIQLFTQQYPDGAIRGQFSRFGKNSFGSDNTSGFEDYSGPPGRIPAPGAVLPMLVAGAGLLGRRRR